MRGTCGDQRWAGGGVDVRGVNIEGVMQSEMAEVVWCAEGGRGRGERQSEGGRDAICRIAPPPCPTRGRSRALPPKLGCIAAFTAAQQSSSSFATSRLFSV